MDSFRFVITTMPAGLSGCTELRHTVAMWQHFKWNIAHANHGDNTSAYLMVWKQSPSETQILRLEVLAHTNPTIYYRRAEDFSVELIPDTELMHEVSFETINLRTILGR
eukprot:2862311-Amphidinium_carterae.5